MPISTRWRFTSRRRRHPRSSCIEMNAPGNNPRTAADRAHRRLHRWLVESAYPLWSTRGYDQLRGGFQERLSPTGEPLEEPRRARVQPRQVYAFACAPELGWTGPARDLVSSGLKHYFERYRRPDGLFRTLSAPDGSVLDDRALLYDQAFALLGLAAATRFGRSEIDLEGEADRLRLIVMRILKRKDALGFDTGDPPELPFQSNPHMHLLEASLAWAQISSADHWLALAEEIVELALTHFIDVKRGCLREFFDAEWKPVPGAQGRVLEPGHHFEWAWLLLRWKGKDAERAHQTALALIRTAERHGVREGFAINSLLDDFSAHDGSARLWPQTERLKANALAAQSTGEAAYWGPAAEAAEQLERYLQTPHTGLWFDRWLSTREFVNEPAPASSFYHIVGAIAELGAQLR